MSKLIVSKGAQKLIDDYKLDVASIEATGKDNTMTVGNVKTWINKNTKIVLPVEIIREPTLQPIPESDKNTTVKFYQLGRRHGEYIETWNYYVDIKRVGDIDVRKLAVMVGNTLHKITATIVKSGVKTAFIPSKEMWFEIKNANQHIDSREMDKQLNGVVGQGMKLAIRGKKGDELVPLSEMINRVLLAFELTNDLHKYSNSDLFIDTKKVVTKKIAKK